MRRRLQPHTSLPATRFAQVHKRLPRRRARATKHKPGRQPGWAARRIWDGDGAAAPPARGRPRPGAVTPVVARRPLGQCRVAGVQGVAVACVQGVAVAGLRRAACSKWWCSDQASATLLSLCAGGGCCHQREPIQHAGGLRAGWVNPGWLGTCAWGGRSRACTLPCSCPASHRAPSAAPAACWMRACKMRAAPPLLPPPHPTAEYTETGHVRPPSGSTLTGVVPSGTWKAKDGVYVIIGGNGNSGGWESGWVGQWVGDSGWVGGCARCLACQHRRPPSSPSLTALPHPTQPCCSVQPPDCGGGAARHGAGQPAVRHRRRARAAREGNRRRARPGLGSPLPALGACLVIAAAASSTPARLAAPTHPSHLGPPPTHIRPTRRRRQVIEAYVASHTSEEVLAAMQAARVPAGPILSTKDIVEEPQYQARGMMQRAAAPSGAPPPAGRVLVPCRGGVGSGSGAACGAACGLQRRGGVCTLVPGRPSPLPALRACPCAHSRRAPPPTPLPTPQAARRSRCPRCCRCCTARPAARAGRGRSWGTTRTPFCETSWAWGRRRSRGCGRWAPSSAG